MMKIGSFTGVLILGLAAWFGLAASPSTVPPAESPAHGTEVVAAETEDPGCLAGCAAAAPATDPLGAERIEALLRLLEAGEPTATAALEELLFHGAEVRAHLAEHGALRLSPEALAGLRRELATDHCLFTVRIVDADGVERVHLSEPVPFGIKQHLHPHDAVALTPPELSFTLQRVGVKHFWARF